MIERDSGELIGDAGLSLLDGRGPEVEVGYTLARAWWGKGYATEAAGALLTAGFDDFGLDEIVAVADPANAASTRVLEKIGMRRVEMRRASGRPHASIARSARGGVRTRRRTPASRRSRPCPRR